jgi:hypothetical protein
VITIDSVISLDQATVDLLGIVAVAALILILAIKELVGVRAGRRGVDPRLRFASQALNAPILALLSVFLVILVVRVWAAI